MLKHYTLLRSQKNRTYELLRQGGLEPAEFSWAKEEIAGSLIVSRLNYRDGTYYFQFSSHEVNAWCTACPGQFRNLDHEYPKSWEEQEGIFKKWVAHLKREIAAPDPWAELAKYKLALGGDSAPEIANETISAHEAERIAEALVRVGDALVRELELGDDDAALVRARLVYLAEAAKREKSLDWLYTALGVYTTVGVTLAVPEATLATLWQVFQAQVGPFAHLTGHGTGAPGTMPKTPIGETSAPPGAEAKPRKRLGLFF
jgi:hypothetical protein